MMNLTRAGLAVAVAVGMGVLFAGTAAAQGGGGGWGEPVLADDFERAELGDDWEVAKGECSIKDGKLTVTSKGNLYLFYKKKLASNMAIEFDGMIPDTKKACDLTAIVSANEFEPAIRHYQGTLGTQGNKYSALHRGKVSKEGDEIIKKIPLKITPGKWHRIRVERQDKFLRFFVDGKKVLEYEDPLAFAPASHNRVGIYTYGSPAYFDNVKIYTRPVSKEYRADEMKKWDAVYEGFNKFCIENFGAEKEPMIYDKFGKDLSVMADGSWRHVSEGSAAIAWETNLPAKGYVEYGETARYGKKSVEDERHFYLHVHRLKGLKPGKTYHYRTVSVDERGNKLAGKDETITPRKTPGAIYIPGDMAGPPYKLEKAGATYVLTEDIVTDSTAIEVAAGNITVDLNGHTITYNDTAGALEAVPSTKNIRRAFHGFKGAPGIMGGRSSSGAKLYNGVIKQGKGGSGNVCDPILGLRCSEIAGITIDYYGYQMNGFIWAGSVDDLHHNVVIDKGTELVDRHWAVRAVGDCKKVHHNLIKRCRQRGVTGAGDILHNEIYMDSYATNSLGMGGKKVVGNRVLGGGVHICAVAWVNGMQVTGNLIHLQAQASKTGRWSEYGSGKGSSSNGIRLTQYGSGNTASSNPLYLNNLYSDNLILINARRGGSSRGVQFSSHLQTKNLVCKDTIIKIISLDGKGRGSCVVTQGRNADNVLPVYYRNCTFMADKLHLKFGDGYSRGSNHHFEGCKFVRVGDDPDYHTFALYRGWSNRHVFLDCEFSEGAKYNDVDWGSKVPAQAYYSVAWTVTVKTVPGAKVTITDRMGKEVFSGAADGQGVASAPVTQCTIRPPSWKPNGPTGAIERTDTRVEESFTPHQITVEKNGRSARKKLTVDMTREIALRP